MMIALDPAGRHVASMLLGTKPGQKINFRQGDKNCIKFPSPCARHELFEWPYTGSNRHASVAYPTLAPASSGHVKA